MKLISGHQNTSAVAALVCCRGAREIPQVYVRLCDLGACDVLTPFSVLLFGRKIEEVVDDVGLPNRWEGRCRGCSPPHGR